MAVSMDSAEVSAPNWDAIGDTDRLAWITDQLARVSDVSNPVQQHGYEELLGARLAFLLSWKGRLLDAIQAENATQRHTGLVGNYRHELTQLRAQLRRLHDANRDLGVVLQSAAVIGKDFSEPVFGGSSTRSAIRRFQKQNLAQRCAF